MKTTRFFFLFLSVLAGLAAGAQSATALPRSLPEKEGVPSGAIAAFLDSIAVSKHEFHSFMLLRHGKVIAEGWWQPYRPDLKHTLYSLSKSFTATAVGFARAEGKLSLDDKVLSFFPNEAPVSPDAKLQALSVKDLLTMSVGQEPDPTGIVVQDSNWVQRFFSLPVKHQPGSRFLYNSMATYMLSAIVQKQTGEKLFDYLRPRLFQPLGISSADWETDPKGISTGGWGLRLTTEDIAKFAQLFLQKGKWQGRQVLPEGWAEEASTAHIIQHPEYGQAKRDSSDWEQGYGYQMWRCRYNAYRGDGAFGQYAIVLPEQDAVIAITSETGDMQGELNLIWKVLLPALKNEGLPADQKAHAALQKSLSSLALPVKKDTVRSVPFAAGSERKFILEPNPMQLQSAAFGLHNQTVQLRLGAAAGDHTFSFGQNNWQAGETTLRGPYLVSAAKNNLTGLPPFRVAGEYTWLDGRTLELVLRYIESPHSQTWTCRFDDDKVSIEVKRSFSANAPGAVVRLQGKLDK